MESQWTQFRSYPSLVEAEFDKERLEGGGIPVLLKGPETGIFGPGFSGASAFGVDLLVPKSQIDAARELAPDG